MGSKAKDKSKYAAWIDPHEVKPYEKNAKIHDKKQVKNIVNSIRRFGWQQDVVITSDNVLVIGHGRRLAALELGCEMPYHMIDKTADELTDADIRELRIADNQTNAETGLDFDILNGEILDLNFEGFDFDFGQPQEKEEADEEIFEDEVPAAPEEPTTKLGDVYKLGDHRLICGDSTDIETIETLMDGAKADMVFTDPPYNIAMSRSKVDGSDNSIKNDNLSAEEYVELLRGAFSNSIKYCKTQTQYWWIGFRQYSTLEKIFEENNIKISNCIVWDKGSIGLGGNGYRYQHELCIFSGETNNKSASDVWRFDRSTEGLHPTMKPVTLVAHAIKNIAKVESVLDLFGGSGSTVTNSYTKNATCASLIQNIAM